MNALILLQTAAQQAGTTAETIVNPVSTTMPYGELAVKGGWIMIPILLLSIVAVFIFVDRYIAVRAAMRTDQSFMNRIRDYILDGKMDSAMALCQNNDTPVARMIEKGISRIGRPLTDINSIIENVGRVEVAKLEKGTPWLAMVAGGAPMLGFLGTVTGMIKAFYDMAQAGSNVNIQILSSGIYEAMVSTVAGLIVGIMGYFAYNILVARIEQVVNMLESTTLEFMDLLNEPVK